MSGQGELNCELVKPFPVLGVHLWAKIVVLACSTELIY